MSKDAPTNAGRKALRLTPKSMASTKLDLQPGTTTIPVSDILLRKDDDTRSLSADHVVGLAECISVLGLLQPIVVDTEGHLLAGGHRLAALQLLAIKDRMERMREFFNRLGEPMPALEALEAAATAIQVEDEDRTNTKAKVQPALRLALRLGALNLEFFQQRHPDAKVSVQVVDVTGRDKKDHALAIETAENTVRRQYTKDEVVALADRLKAAGYTEVAGKPKQGVSPLMPALAAALGRSKRQIQRILNPGEDEQSTKGEWDLALAAFERAAERLHKVGKGKNGEDADELRKAAKVVLDVKAAREKKLEQEKAAEKDADKKKAKKAATKANSKKDGKAGKKGGAKADK